MKKGLSAMVSSILLIVFVISLGVLIMGWNRGLISKSVSRSETRIGSELECSDVKLRLECDEVSPGVCGDYIIIKNNGDKDLYGYVVREIDADGKVKVIERNNALDKITAYGATTYAYPLGIKKIEIIPRINLAEEGEEIVDCTTKIVAYTF